MTIKIAVPDKVEYIIDELIAHGYEAYAVGGCVRDSILGRKPGDWDITTSAKPYQVKEIFRRTVDTGILHGTVTVMLGKDGFEVTTYRIDGEYEDNRHPKNVEFTKSLEEDLKRRDFTINAMAYNNIVGIVDLFGGMEDLKAKNIRCVGNPIERFEEDALRILRAVRFAGQLGFSIEESTVEAIRDRVENLVNISAERIRVELCKLLVSKEPQRFIDAYEMGITKVVLPEFDRMMETEQNNPHHNDLVGVHTINTIKAVSNMYNKLKDYDPKIHLVLCLSMLLHDVGKPCTLTRNENDETLFYQYEIKGEVIAKNILKRLKFDNFTIQLVTRLVRNHKYECELNQIAMRKMINIVGEDLMELLFMVRRADIMTWNDEIQASGLSILDKQIDLYKAITKAGECVSLKQLNVNGKDLITIGVKPGKQIGDILSKLLDIVLEDPSKNEKDTLLSLAKETMI